MRVSLILFCLLLGQLVACGGNEVEVQVSGLSPDVQSLAVVAEIENLPASRRVQLIRGRLDSFLLRLPDNGESLTLQVGGLSLEGCRLSEASLKVPLPILGGGPVPVALNRLPSPSCRIAVELVGEGQGKVESDPPGVSCPGRCEAVFSPGTKVRLVATPAARVYFTGWSRSCAGFGECNVTVGEDPVPVRAGFLPAEVCGGAFCWENPLPHGNAIRAIYSRSASEVWAVGDGGLVLRWFGDFFAPVRSGTSATLRAVVGRGSEIFAAGDGGTLLRFDGARFAQVPTKTSARLRALAVRGGELWVAGDAGTVLRGDGSSFVQVPGTPSKDLHALTVSSLGLILAGDGGTALRWDGTSLRSLQTNTTANLRSALEGGGGLRLAGEGGTVLRIDGASPVKEESRTSSDLYTLFGIPEGDLFVAGAIGTLRRFDGSGWRSVSAGTLSSIFAMSGSGPTDAWAGGEGGMLLRWNGAMFVPQRAFDQDPLISVGVTDSQVVRTVGRSGAIRERKEGSWHQIVEGPPFLFADAWIGPKQVWGVGPDGFLMLGDSFQEGSIPNWMVLKVTANHFHGVWQNNRDLSGPLPTYDTWAVGDNTGVYRFEGNAAGYTVSRYPLGGAQVSLRSVHFVSRTEGWIVGEFGVILQVLGNSIVQRPSGTFERLLRVYGLAVNDVWAVGERGVILHYDGTSWSAVPSGVTTALRTLWGSGPKDVWTAGDGGVVRRWDGVRWSAVDAATSVDLRGIVGTNGEAGPIFAVGAGGTILRSDRTARP